MAWVDPKDWSVADGNPTHGWFNQDLIENPDTLRTLNDAAVKVYRTGNLSITNDTRQAFDWHASAYLSGAMWTVGDPRKLLAPIPGLYLLAAHMPWAASNAGRRGLGYRINGAAPDYDMQFQSAQTGTPRQNAVELILMDTAGSWVEMRGYQSSGANLNLAGGDETDVSASWGLVGTRTNGVVKNLVENPSVEVDLTDYSGIGATPTRTAASSKDPVSGDWEISVLTTNAANVGLSYSGVGTPVTTPGKPYTFSAHVKRLVPGTSLMKLRIDWQDAIGTLISSTDNPFVLNSPDYKRVSVMGYAPIGATRARLRILTAVAGGVFTFLADGLQFEQSHVMTAYCDGLMPNCFWNGTANDSQSVYFDPLQGPIYNEPRGWTDGVPEGIISSWILNRELKDNLNALRWLNGQAAKCYLDEDLGVSAGERNPITWAKPEFQVGKLWQSGSQFVAQVPGWYMPIATLEFQGDPDVEAKRGCGFTISGRPTAYDLQVQSGGQDNVSCNGSTVIRLEQGEYIEFYAYHEGSVAMSLRGGRKDMSRVSVHLYAA